jgi:hypothetical protein
VRREWALAFAFLLLLAPLVAACDGKNTQVNSAQAGAATNDPPTTLKRAFARLTHTPQGSVDFTSRPDDRTLTVALNLFGLAPISTHPAHIHSGDCDATGPIQYDLGALVADAQGKISSTVIQPDVEGGIPPQGWSLDIHNASGSDPYSLIQLACAHIQSASAGATHPQTVHISVVTGVGPSMSASGQATLEIEDDKLVVVATMSGLEPFSTHPLFIQQGDCAHPGASVFSLSPVQADSRGQAKVKQGFAGVATIPNAAWSLVVLRGVHLQSQIDAAPITCGAIAPAP